MRHFLSVGDYSAEELQHLLLSAKEGKSGPKSTTVAEGKTLAMVFQKPSNRTRVSFEVGMYQLGGYALMLKEEEIGMGTREPIADVSRVLSRFVDLVMIRPLYHSDIVEFASFATVPVINGLSDLYHPCQACADTLTMLEHKGSLQGLRLCYIGDGNNVCNSLIIISAKLGIELVVCCPRGYEPSIDQNEWSYALIYEPQDAIRSADVVYTDTWISMGPSGHSSDAVSDFVGYAVSEELLNLADPSAIFMHCLPAHRGEEVTTEVIEGSQSVVFDQAENRLHAQKAVMQLLLQG